MEIITLILGIVFSILCWWIYHSIFNVYYVGGVGKGCLSEIVGSLLLGFILAALVTAVITSGFQVIWRHKVILAVVVIIIVSLYLKFKDKQ